MTVAVEQRAQPQGLEGCRYTAREVSRIVREHRDDQRIHSWVSKVLMRSPDLHPRDMHPATQIERARAIDAAFRLPFDQGGVGWMPDPTRRETIVAPYLLVNGEREAFFAAKDCANVTAAWLAAFLCSLSAVAIPCAVVAHGYRSDLPLVGHILAAIATDWTWKEKYYVDRSQDLPFGLCTPFKWEYLVDALTGEELCDAEVCLRPEGLDPRIVRRMEGSQPNVETMNVVSGLPPELSNSAGAAPSLADLEAWKRLLSDDAARLQEAAGEALRLATAVGKIAEQGTPIEGWSFERSQALATALAAAKLLVPWLLEAATGKRKIIVAPDGSGFALERLDTDDVVIGGDATSFWLEGREGLRLTNPVTFGNVASGPELPIIVLGLISGLIPLAISALSAFLIYETLVTLREVVRTIGKAAIVREYAKCLEKNDVLACTRWLAEQKEIEQAEVRHEEAKNKPFLEALDFGKVVLGVGVLGGAVLLGKYVYEELTPARRGRGGRRLNPGPTTPGRSMRIAKVRDALDRARTSAEKASEGPRRGETYDEWHRREMAAAIKHRKWEELFYEIDPSFDDDPQRRAENIEWSRAERAKLENVYKHNYGEFPR